MVDRIDAWRARDGSIHASREAASISPEPSADPGDPT